MQLLLRSSATLKPTAPRQSSHNCSNIAIAQVIRSAGRLRGLVVLRGLLSSAPGVV